VQTRLKEQAQRGHQWLVQQDRLSLVQRALQPFLSKDSTWGALSGTSHHKDMYTLQNEGAALLEGGVYGGEVIMACHAATQCGADIYLADRSKALSNARLLAAQREDRLRMLEHMPEGTPLLATRVEGKLLGMPSLCQRLCMPTS
jgi:hypothetical protein